MLPNLPATKSHPRRTLGMLLILLTIAAYLPAVGAGYIWDDDTLLTANPQMRSVAGLGQIWSGEGSRDYTPVTLSSFWLEWRLWGANPVGYHLVNILLHALSAVLLWRILERLRVPGAWLAGVLFAVHPVNVASVAWVAEMKNTLSGMLFLAAALCFLRARDERRWVEYGASLGLFLLAALSKGAVVTMPAVLVLCVLWKERKVTWRDILQVAPYAVMAVGVAALTIKFQARAEHYGLIPDTMDYRVARAGAAIWFYLGALVWPAGMSPIREPWLPDLRSPLTYLPAIAAAAMFGMLFWKRRSWGRPGLFAYSYYLAMLLPVLGFVWMTLMQETPSADWWQYLAAPGMFALAAGGVAVAARRWRVVKPVAGLVVAMLVIQTWRRAEIYESMASYCVAVTEEDPHAWTLQNNLGILLKRAGRFEEAEGCYRQALRDNPGYVEAHLNLGNMYGAEGKPAEKEAELRRANEMRPGDPRIVGELEEFYAGEGRKEDVVTMEREAVKANPGNVENIYKLGAMLMRTGRFAEGEQCFRHGLALAPESMVLRMELCEALAEQGKKKEAYQVCGEVEGLARKSGNANAISAAAELRSFLSHRDF